MYLLPLDVDTAPFRFLPYLIIPVVAIVIIALGVYLARHRAGKRRS
jgi:hypothetical protein